MARRLQLSASPKLPERNLKISLFTSRAKVGEILLTFRNRQDHWGMYIATYQGMVSWHHCLLCSMLNNR